VAAPGGGGAGRHHRPELWVFPDFMSDSVGMVMIVSDDRWNALVHR
jgi:hypothetical protein